MSLQNIRGNARALPLADGSVQCVVTSPPYWGLRKYSGEQECVWSDNEKCRHKFVRTIVPPLTGGRNQGGKKDDPDGCTYRPREAAQHATCKKCGAWRGAFGLEPTIEMYLQHTIEILREIRRVLRPDGVVFWNIGDSYAHGVPGGGSVFSNGRTDGRLGGGDSPRGRTKIATLSPGLKPKDLCLIPARVAIAAQTDGWWVRSMIIWAKPNPMPESCTDRPTDSYEHVIMLTKSAKYFWDAEAVREPCTAGWHGNQAFDGPKTIALKPDTGKSERNVSPFRNLRNVWNFATQPYKGAHFATFPEELPRRCILAATSERGACAECGAPWVRVLEKIKGDPESFNGSTFQKGKTKQAQDMLAATGTGERTAEVVTIGWEKSCRCAGEKTKPCVVLDPFGGSGTTARVAIELNRYAISVDLAYHDHSNARTSHVQRRLAAL